MDAKEIILKGLYDQHKLPDWEGWPNIEKETGKLIYMAMDTYASQQTASLQAEVERLRKTLEKIANIIKLMETSNIHFVEADIINIGDIVHASLYSSTPAVDDASEVRFGEFVMKREGLSRGISTSGEIQCWYDEETDRSYSPSQLYSLFKSGE